MPPASWPRWRRSHQQRAAQPGAVVEREHERRPVDPGRPEGGRERAGVGEGMAAAVGRVDRRAVRSCLRVEVDGAGDVALVVGGAGAAVDERIDHSAPRGGDGEARARRAPGTAARAAAAQAAAIVGPDDHGRPRAGERRAARARRRLGADGSSDGDGAVRLVQPVVERRREQLGVRRRGARAEQRGARGVNAASACGTTAGSAPRDASVDVRVARHDGDGCERQRVGDPRDPAVPGQRHAADERGGEVVGVGSSSSASASSSSASRPARRRAARARSPPRDEPSPRSSGIRLRKRNRLPAGSASSA